MKKKIKKFIFLDEVWALIPAKLNSRGIKRKNLKKINKKTLLQYSIETAKLCNTINKVYVSTESNLIKNLSLKYGAIIERLRNKKNAKNNSTDLDVLRDFIYNINEKKLPKILVYLRPTTPFRNPRIIDNAINKFIKLKNYDSMVSVEEMSETIFKKFLIKKIKSKKYLFPILKKMSLDDANKPRQFFNKSYSGNGYFDIIKTKNILKGYMIGKKCYPLITNSSIDINNYDDLKYAHFIKSRFSL